MTSYQFTAANKDLFKQIAARLNKAEANVAMESDFEHWKQYQETKWTDMPYVGSGIYNGVEGFYLKAYRDYFNISSKAIEQLFPMNIDGFEVKMVSFSDFDWDDDRTWPESIGLAIFKDGQNVLESFAETVARSI